MGADRRTKAVPASGSSRISLSLGIPAAALRSCQQRKIMVFCGRRAGGAEGNVPVIT